MQRGYFYLLTARMGRDFPADFSPQLTPKRMLEMGVFGGKYMTDCRGEFPASWFARAKLSPEKADPALNFFGVRASQPLAVWRAKGWIYEEDPRGWFQWYCRYYMGRRCPDDARQIKQMADDAAAHRADKKTTAAKEMSAAAPGSGRRCCIGGMMRPPCEAVACYTHPHKGETL